MNCFRYWILFSVLAFFVVRAENLSAQDLQTPNPIGSGQSAQELPTTKDGLILEGRRSEFFPWEFKAGDDGLVYYEPPRITPQTSTARIARRPKDENLVEKPTHFSYYRRPENQTGDYKVVTVPAIHPRQAKIDAQTYHIGWDATDVWMGQSRVMYNVLLKKRPEYIPGTQPIPHPIPKIRRN